jgi:threonine dehydratase
MHYLSPYNDTQVIAGQATVGYELEQQLDDDPLTILCPVGGGGLLSGLCMWARELPHVRLVGVETRSSPAMAAALDANGVTPIDVRPTLADGVAGNLEAGTVTYSIIRDRVDEMVSVSEEEIQAAMHLLLTDAGIVSEGAGALAAAAVITSRATIRGRAVVLVTGRYVSVATLAGILDRA